MIASLVGTLTAVAAAQGRPAPRGGSNAALDSARAIPKSQPSVLPAKPKPVAPAKRAAKPAGPGSRWYLAPAKTPMKDWILGEMTMPAGDGPWRFTLRGPAAAIVFEGQRKGNVIDYIIRDEPPRPNFNYNDIRGKITIEGPDRLSGTLLDAKGFLGLDTFMFIREGSAGAPPAERKGVLGVPLPGSGR